MSPFQALHVTVTLQSCKNAVTKKTSGQRSELQRSAKASDLSDPSDLSDLSDF